MKRFTKNILYYSNEWLENPQKITVFLNKDILENVRICQALIKAGVMHSANIAIVAESFTDEEGKTVDWSADETLLVVHNYRVAILSRNVDQDEAHFDSISNEELFSGLTEHQLREDI